MLASSLSAARLVLAQLVFLLIWKEKFSTASFFIVLAALSDFLDGWVARRFNQKTTVGSHLDHIADKVFVLLTLLGFYLTNRVDLLPIVLLAVREIFITFARFYGIAAPTNVFGKIKTTLEFIALIALCWEPPLGQFLLWVAVLSAYLSGLVYIYAPRQTVK